VCTVQFTVTLYSVHLKHNNDDKSGKGKEVVRKYRGREYIFS